MLLDSTFITDLVRKDEDAVARLEVLIEEETPVEMSPLTVFEVGVGLRGDAAILHDRFQAVVDDLEIAPLGLQQAQQALTIQRRLSDRGEPIGAVDVLLAGTASTLDDPRILSRNVNEFERVSAIEVVDY
jgi:predicted nucleic acid-binding protein